MYKNECPVDLEELRLDSAYLFKIPTAVSTYYYIGSLETMLELKQCPITRHSGLFYAVKLNKLSPIDLKQLENRNKPGYLIDDIAELNKRTIAFSWEQHYFNQQELAVSPIRSGGTLGMGVALLVWLSLVAYQMSQQKATTHSSECDLMLFIYASFAGLLAGSAKYFTHRTTLGQHGIFTAPFRAASNQDLGQAPVLRV